MDVLMRFPDARKRVPAVDAWLRRPGELHGLARAWFGRMRQCGPDVREVMHDGHPTACVGDAAFAEVNVFTAHANVGFFLGVGLPDPAGLLEGSGRRMRHVKLRPGRPVDAAALAALVDAAYRRVKAVHEAAAGRDE